VPSAFIASIQQQIKASPIIMKELETQAAKVVSSIISSDTPDDVRATTIQHKTNEFVELIAKQKATEQSFAVHHQHADAQLMELPYAEGTLFSAFSDPIKIGRVSGQAMEVRNIAIPRLMLTPHYSELIIDNFDLDVRKLSRFATGASIMEQRLQGTEEIDLFGNAHQGDRETVVTRVTSLGEGRAQSPESTIIAALTDHPLIDYDDPNQTALLLKLAMQTVSHYKSFVSEDIAVKMMVENNTQQIAQEIYDQILEHKKFVSEGYLESSIREPKPYLEQFNISRDHSDQPVTLESQLNKFPREKIYTSFNKACHSMYRFDSSDEARLAYVLEKDPSILDWLRPAPNQFEGLYWRDESGNSQHRYEPDFVAELENEIVMIEVKPSIEVEIFEVQSKMKTAEKYCELASKNVGKFGIVKPWRYVIIPTERITVTSTIAGLI
jgi:type III restriction enzyme